MKLLEMVITNRPAIGLTLQNTDIGQEMVSTSKEGKLEDTTQQLESGSMVL